MKYEELIERQIDRIRQIRNDEINNYPRAIETLWILIRNTEGKKKIEGLKQEYQLKHSSEVNGPDLELWDLVFDKTLDIAQDYGVY